MKVSPLTSRFPPVNVPGAPSDKAYARTHPADSDETVAYKQQNRDMLAQLLSDFYVLNNRPRRVLFLEGPGFHFSRTLSTLFFSSSLECDVPNWNAGDLCASISARETRKLQARFQSLNVYGASLEHFMEAVSKEEEERLYNLIWLDYCGHATHDRLKECADAVSLLARDQVVVLATTFCSRYDSASPVHQDHVHGYERTESLFARTLAAAAHAGFMMLDWLHSKDNGMIMMTYVLAHTSLVVGNAHVTYKVNLAMAKARGKEPLVVPVPPDAALAPPTLQEEEEDKAQYFYNITSTSFQGKIHAHATADRCKAVLALASRNMPRIDVHDPEAEKRPMCKFCLAVADAGGNGNSKKRERDDEEEKEQEEEQEEVPFPPKAKVCVNLTDLPGCERNKYCHMDGTVYKAQGQMRLVRVGRHSVRVGVSRLDHQRPAEPDKVWTRGDRVQVLEENEGAEGWWDATIVRKARGVNLWIVRWRGHYEEHGDVSAVHRDLIRRGKW